jgi:anti-sigma factor RsiW
MNCQQAKPLVGPYADGELEAATILELERHLGDCAGCARELQNLQGLKNALKADDLYFTAPVALRQGIEAELPSPAREARARPTWNWNWLTTTMSGAFAVCLALLIMVTQNRVSPDQQFAQEIVSGHIRSLMGNHLMDVVSSDQHTVKPWFNGKVDFSPPVKDMASQDFPLAGGRLDYIGGRSVSALVFQRHKHVINLFIWPASEKDLKPMPAATIQGYNVIHWADAGMTFWAVSDLNGKELMEFVQDYSAAVPLK